MNPSWRTGCFCACFGTNVPDNWSPSFVSSSNVVCNGRIVAYDQYLTYLLLLMVSRLFVRQDVMSLNIRQVPKSKKRPVPSWFPPLPDPELLVRAVTYLSLYSETTFAIAV